MPDDNAHEANPNEGPAVAQAPPRAEPKRPTARPSNKPNPKTLPPHAVVLHNDPKNGFDFVITSLMKVFGYNALRAFKLTTTAHLKGRSIVWTGHKEYAELKAQQLKARGPDPVMKAKGARPLNVTVELLPK